MIRDKDDAALLMRLAAHHRNPNQYEAYFEDKRDKKKVQENYRRKVRLAKAHGGPLPNQDWSAMDAILRSIFNAHRASS